jgi:hypothetical protein
MDEYHNNHAEENSKIKMKYTLYDSIYKTLRNFKLIYGDRKQTGSMAA